MAMHLGQSTLLITSTPQNPYNALVTKKISDYVFRFEDKIGQGNFSKVYKGHHQFTNQTVAIKIIELSSIKSAKLQQLLFSEIEVIQSLHHPNILKCYQVLKSQHNCYIITELCNGGDLQSLLKKQKCLNQFSAAPYIRDIYRGLLYLGQRGIVHRDLKSANIFLHNGVCKIADFGFAKYTNNVNFYDMDIGSPLYMSPQGMISNMYGMKTDIWAFGIIIYELLHGQTPFAYCDSEYDLKTAVSSSLSYHSIRQDLPNDVKQLILKCLIVDYKHRPDAIALKNDAYIYQIMSSHLEPPHYVKMVEPNQTYGNQNYVQMNTIENYPKLQSKTSTSALSNHSVHFHNSIPVQQQIIPIQQKNNHDTLHQMNVVHYHNSQSGSHQQYSSQNHSHIHAENRTHIHVQNQPYMHADPHIHIEPQPYPYKEQTHIHIEPQPHIHIEPKPRLHIETHQIQQQQYIPIQYGGHSPIRIINGFGTSKQASMKGSKRNETIHLNEISSGKIMNTSSSGNIIYPQSYQRINIVHTDHTPVIYSKRTQSQARLIPEQHYQRQKQLIPDNFDSMSNSSWSHDKVGRQKFNKSSSHQHINMLQNNLMILNSQPVKYHNDHPKIVMRTLSNPHDRVTYQQNQYQTYRANQLPTLHHTISYQSSLQTPVDRQQNSKEINQSSHINLNFRQENEKSKKKFGQIIKKDMKLDSNVKSSTKLMQIMGEDANIKLQRSKAKSHIAYDPVVMTQYQQSPTKIRSQRRSFAESPTKKQDGIIETKLQFNQANGQLQRNVKQMNHNIITAIMEFKESVGFLHYCRLYNKFYVTLRRIMLSLQVKRYDVLEKIFKNSEFRIQVYGRYLLTSLNELIEHIRCKQIIYDGNDYKKKKLKEDKLLQVSVQYYRKYEEDINRNRASKIIPGHDNTTTINYIKEYNEQFWGVLDKGYGSILQLMKNGNEVSDNFVKYYRTLCYLSLRVSQGNSMIVNCIGNNNYKLLGEVMIQNWLEQQYISEQTYGKVKNDYFNKNMYPTHIINHSNNNVSSNMQNVYSVNNVQNAYSVNNGTMNNGNQFSTTSNLQKVNSHENIANIATNNNSHSHNITSHNIIGSYNNTNGHYIQQTPSEYPVHQNHQIHPTDNNNRTHY